MVLISFNQHELKINSQNNIDLSRAHILRQLERFGIQRKSDDMLYCTINPRSALVNLIELLIARGIPYQLDINAEKLFREHKEELVILQSAKIAGLESQQSIEIANIEIPGFKRVLFPYQMKALHHMISVQNPANFSVPGSGKTTMAYAFYQFLKNQNIVDKLLVIGPISSFKVWEEEFEECIEDANCKKITRLNGSGRQKLFNNDAYSVYITNFHLIPNDRENLIEHIQNTGRYLIIVDEAHYIKNPDEGIIKNALLDLAPYATRRMIATGTPCPNTLMDLHSQMAFLWPSEGVTGSKYEFQQLINQSIDVVREKVTPYFYRIQKDTLDLDEPNLEIIPVCMEPTQKKIYDSILDKAVNFITRFNNNDAMLLRWRRAWAIRLNQVLSNPSLLISSDEDFEPGFVPLLDAHTVELVHDYHILELPGKFATCLNKLKDLKEKKVNKVVIWTNFKKNINMLKSLLDREGWEVKVVTGDISNKENIPDNRDQVISEFRNTRNPAILLATPASCAEAISLHKHCHEMIFIDLTFNAAHWMQAKDRIHRIGMEKGIVTNYYVFQVSNTYDQTIFERVIRKENQMKAVCNCELPLPSDSEEEISFEGLISNEDEVFSALEAELIAWGEMPL